MKENFKLAINSPCSEKFDSFEPTEQGGFCSACAKEVIDFTKMTDQEIVDFFDQNTGEVCGNFRESQLKTYQFNTQLSAHMSYASLGIVGLSLVSLLASSPTLAQEKKPKIEVWQGKNRDSVKPLFQNKNKQAILTGVIKDKDGPLPGVSVLLKGTSNGTDSDFDGKFKFPVKIGDVLIISYLGYETIEIKIDWFTQGPLTINMKEGGEVLDCIVVTGKVQVDQLFSSKRSWFRKQKRAERKKNKKKKGE